MPRTKRFSKEDKAEVTLSHVEDQEETIKVVVEEEETKKVSIKRYQATVSHPLGAKTYVGPSLESKQVGLLRKRQSVRVLKECNGFGLVGEAPERWCPLENLTKMNEYNTLKKKG